MKPRNFPGRKAARKTGVPREQRKRQAPHVADIRFRVGASARQLIA